MKRTIFLLAALVITLSPMKADPGKGKGKGHGQGAGESRGKGDREADHRVHAVTFESMDRRVIVDYYHAQPGGLPPGLAKRGDLPPGLEKQLRRNGTLPPGLQKKLVAFPRDVEVRLPPCPPDVRRGMIGGVAVMWNSRTGLIVDAAFLF